MNVTQLMRRRRSNGNALLLLLLLSACGGYGGETSSVENPGVVRSDSEYCELTLPDGWTWFPAQWAAESPNGTRMLFEDARYGRPENPDWEEVTQAKVASVRDRNPDATITEDTTSVTIDYGEEAGYAFLQRFDRVGCQVTFTNARETRAAEFDDWQEIIATFRRISPDPTFTPPTGP